MKQILKRSFWLSKCPAFREHEEVLESTSSDSANAAHEYHVIQRVVAGD
jgi:hypothetical protein